jgi:hypothetical protein
VCASFCVSIASLMLWWEPVIGVNKSTGTETLTFVADVDLLRGCFELLTIDSP